MPSKLELSHLKLSQATLEIRYDNAYILWDRTGLVWSEVSSIWSDLKMVEAKPMVSTFILNDRFELAVKLDRAHFIDMKPTSSLKEFIELSEIFIDLVSKSLEIKKFGRLGFRLIYNKQFPDKITAANTLISTKIMAGPQGKHFNIEGKILLPKYSLFWEGESTAIHVTLAAQDKKIELDISPEIEEVSAIHIEKHEVIFDIDYYTLCTVSKGQLDIKEWISQAYHLIKRDSKVFMGI